MKQYKCLCCGYKTLSSRGEFDICPVCYWEDDAYLIINSDLITSLYFEFKTEFSIEKLLDIKSGANHGLTLQEGRENFRLFGACEKEMIPYVNTKSFIQNKKID